jgi:hypothetical protein
VEDQSEATVYHVGNLPLSWLPKQRLKSVPFTVDDQQFRTNGRVSLVNAERTVMSIAPPRIPYSYGVAFALNFAAVPDAAYLLEIDARVTQGTIGFGLFDKDDALWRVAVMASPKRVVVHLPVADARTAGRFVIQQWDSDEEAHVDIMGLALWEERAWWDLEDAMEPGSS